MAGAHLPRDRWILLIGIGKMFKCVALVTLGIVALTLVHKDVGAELRRWAFAVGLNPGAHILSGLIARGAALDGHHLEIVSVLLFLYSALFAIEGTGLLTGKRWGEYTTIGITGSFIPIEVFETVREPHLGRIVMTVLNVAAVAYLVHHLKARTRREGLLAQRTA